MCECATYCIMGIERSELRWGREWERYASAQNALYIGRSFKILQMLRNKNVLELFCKEPTIIFLSTLKKNKVSLLALMVP